MAISTAPPKRRTPSEADIEAVINRGGKPTTNSAPDEDDKPAHVNTRLTKKIIHQIDALRAQRPRKPGSPKLGISLHDWVVEAVIEKLERDSALKTAQK